MKRMFKLCLLLLLCFFLGLPIYLNICPKTHPIQITSITAIWEKTAADAHRTDAQNQELASPTPETHVQNQGLASPDPETHGQDQGLASTNPEAYDQDSRLTLTAHETYAYDKDNAPGSPMYGLSAYENMAKSYSAEEIAQIPHTYFDGQGRMVYTLGTSGGGNHYCEEHIYEWNDEEHTCRNIYYKANFVPGDSIYYVTNRYLYDIGYYQFSEDGRLLSWLLYSRGLDSSNLNYWSDELFFNRGYKADYDGNLLMSEVMYYDYWNTNEYGSWKYRFYQYDGQDRCILRITVSEDEFLLSKYEYDKTPGQVDEYVYRLEDDWLLTCEDGSTLLFRPEGGLPAITKTAANGTVEKEFFYGKKIDMGQQHYLMPQDVEETIADHKYAVQPGDCLWDIAYAHYGQIQGGNTPYWICKYCDLLYRVNRKVIGKDKNMLLPGTRLYIPEIEI